MALFPLDLCHEIRSWAIICGLPFIKKPEIQLLCILLKTSGAQIVGVNFTFSYKRYAILYYEWFFVFDSIRRTFVLAIYQFQYNSRQQLNS